jgi:predicted dehydrogenase
VIVTKVRWGVLGAAKIAIEKVIPAMQRGERSDVVAIASRDPAKARKAAVQLGVPKAYGSYEELLDDPGIDAIYNPLPNHLHRQWTIAAAERGKHVLCEKPIGLSAREAEEVIAVRDRTGVAIQEAFMVRTHPQWTKAVELCRSGRLGQVRSYMVLDGINVVYPLELSLANMRAIEAVFRSALTGQWERGLRAVS